MKSFLSIPVIAVSLLDKVPATQADEVVKTWRTNGTGGWNGRFCRALDTGDKHAFVMGYLDGVTNVLIAWSAGSSEGFRWFKKASDVFLPPLTAEEIASALDQI